MKPILTEDGIHLAAWFIVCVFFLVPVTLFPEQIRDSKNLKNVPLFHVVNGKKRIYLSSVVLKKPVGAFFIFKPSCPFCDANIYLWKKLFKKYRNYFDAVGVFLTEPEQLERFRSDKQLPFPVFCPQYAVRFKTTYDISPESSKTLIFDSKRILFEKTGDLTFQDYVKIKTILKQGENQ